MKSNWRGLIDSKGCILRGKDSCLTTQPHPHVTLWLLKVATLSRREMYIIPSHFPLTSVAMISHLSMRRCGCAAACCDMWGARGHRAARDLWFSFVKLRCTYPYPRNSLVFSPPLIIFAPKVHFISQERVGYVWRSSY